MPIFKVQLLTSYNSFRISFSMVARNVSPTGDSAFLLQVFFTGAEVLPCNIVAACLVHKRLISKPN